MPNILGTFWSCRYCGENHRPGVSRARLTTQYPVVTGWRYDAQNPHHADAIASYGLGYRVAEHDETCDGCGLPVKAGKPMYRLVALDGWS